MEPPSSASHRSALHWLAEGVWRRFVLKFYFEIWYLADAPHYALLQAQDSASLSTVPFELSPGVFCLGTKAQVQSSEHSMRRASRLAEELSRMRAERIRFLKRLFLGWHSVALLEIHVREMAASARTAPQPNLQSPRWSQTLRTAQLLLIYLWIFDRYTASWFSFHILAFEHCE